MSDTLQRFRAGETFYGDWFPRQADSAIFRAESVDSAGTNIKVIITFYTKNSDDTGEGSEIKTDGSTADEIELNSSAGVNQVVIESNDDQTIGGLFELVRYKFVVTADTDGWLLGRVFPPVFFDTAAAPAPS